MESTASVSKSPDLRIESAVLTLVSPMHDVKSNHGMRANTRWSSTSRLHPTIVFLIWRI